MSWLSSALRCISNCRVFPSSALRCHLAVHVTITLLIYCIGSDLQCFPHPGSLDVCLCLATSGLLFSDVLVVVVEKEVHGCLRRCLFVFMLVWSFHMYCWSYWFSFLIRSISCFAVLRHVSSPIMSLLCVCSSLLSLLMYSLSSCSCFHHAQENQVRSSSTHGTHPWCERFPRHPRPFFAITEHMSTCALHRPTLSPKTLYAYLLPCLTTSSASTLALLTCSSFVSTHHKSTQSTWGQREALVFTADSEIPSPRRPCHNLQERLCAKPRNFVHSRNVRICSRTFESRVLGFPETLAGKYCLDTHLEGATIAKHPPPRRTTSTPPSRRKAAEHRSS